MQKDNILEPVVKELIDWKIDSQDNNGRFKPTSIFKEYKEWDFSNIFAI